MSLNDSSFFSMHFCSFVLFFSFILSTAESNALLNEKASKISKDVSSPQLEKTGQENAVLSERETITSPQDGKEMCCAFS